jgi:hypothetical protein
MPSGGVHPITLLSHSVCVISGLSTHCGNHCGGRAMQPPADLCGNAAASKLRDANDQRDANGPTAHRRLATKRSPRSRPSKWRDPETGGRCVVVTYTVMAALEAGEFNRWTH